MNTAESLLERARHARELARNSTDRLFQQAAERFALQCEQQAAYLDALTAEISAISGPALLTG